jgi:hypothetical protein
MRILAAVALVLLCGLGAALLWRLSERRRRLQRDEHEAEAAKTLEDVARRWGM